MYDDFIDVLKRNYKTWAVIPLLVAVGLILGLMLLGSIPAVRRFLYPLF